MKTNRFFPNPINILRAIKMGFKCPDSPIRTFALRFSAALTANSPIRKAVKSDGLYIFELRLPLLATDTSMIIILVCIFEELVAVFALHNL